ncbi:MAG: argininosuccinate lyase [Candidatus Aureabacteria bacterium]|nr:argininosuccinate lyase [Candidatus Auribacterota bacterium]
MTKKLWSGRFDKAMAPEVERFTASIGFDRRLYAHDIKGSIAHVRMLSKVGLVSKSELRRIVGGLQKVRAEIEKGVFAPGPEYEDIHMAVETRLKKIVGPVADKLHTARSRNDQVALDTRLFLRDEIGAIVSEIRGLQRSLVKVASKNSALIMPGFTHLQHGQPVLAAHHLLAYVEMLERDIARMEDCLKRVNVLPLGAGAVAGTSLPIDRAYVAKLLGFESVSANSMDAVSDRDYLMEFLAAAAVCGIHLSRMAEEVVLWVSREFSFIEIDLSYCTGSSLMPQKANPDVAELVRGKAGRLLGALVSMLTVMKGLPLSYNRDLQEDKEPLFDAVGTLHASLMIMTGLWERIRFRPVRIRMSVDGDFSQATDLAEFLVMNGCPFREAHHTVGRLVADCIKRGIRIEDLTLKDLRAFSMLFNEKALAILSPEKGIAGKKSYGSTSPLGVSTALRGWKKKLGIKNA